MILQSYIGGRFIGHTSKQALLDAATDQPIAHTHADSLDMSEAVHHALHVGRAALLSEDFQTRGAILRALAKYLLERKESLYELSFATGATRKDSWVDIEGGIATLSAYANIAANELPASNVVHQGPAHALSKTGAFMGSHILTPRQGVAVHINAFNFPVWGALEKFAPGFVAGIPQIIKPATATSYLTEALVKLMLDSQLLPAGSLQLIIGSTGDLLDRLGPQDLVTFTGSADTAMQLKAHANVLKHNIPFNVEADSLNTLILAEDVQAGDAHFDAAVREIVREMTVKAGQKCTAIRRILAPDTLCQPLGEAIAKKLASITIGAPRDGTTQMGPLASLGQQADVRAQIKRLQAQADTLYAGPSAFGPGAYLAPHLLYNAKPFEQQLAHQLEAFGPVATLMPYRSSEEAIALTALGSGSLVASVVSDDPTMVRQLVLGIAAQHGRVHVLDASVAKDSTGHGAPLPSLKHGGPGRAGGGDELGGASAVHHYLQRTAIQASPRQLQTITGEYVRGAPVTETETHPFKKRFDELRVGDSLLTHRRTVSEADIVNFGGISGDYFYAHFDEEAAKNSVFGKRVAHGYFVLSAAAGLFVYPGVSPVLANYGIDTLRFVKPVGIGDTLQARLTCKRKINRSQKPGETPQGVVAWDVEVRNQAQELVASYDILTLVAK